MGRRTVFLCLLCVAAGLAVVGAGTGSALAAPAGPAWEIFSVAQPTNFSREDNAKCAHGGGAFCDRYLVTLTNVGGGPTDENARLVISDTLPPGLKAVGLSGRNLETEHRSASSEYGWTCHVSDTTCTYDGAVAAGGAPVGPGGGLVVDMEVEVEASAKQGSIGVNAATVEGAGAPPAHTGAPLTTSNTVDESASAFGFASFGLAAHEPAGGLDEQAADHPYGVTTTFDLDSYLAGRLSGAFYTASVEPPKDVALYLPLGLVGDPTAAARCTSIQLIGPGGRETECSAGSRVGTVMLFLETGLGGSVEPPGGRSTVTDLYNMVPQAGYPAQFGFKVLNRPVPLYASVVRTPSGYALRIATPGIPRATTVQGAALTFNGNPSSSRAFFTNPATCGAGPLMARAEADSWAEPGNWTTAESVAYPQITGCNLLQFEPTVAMSPEVTEAEAPSGYEIKIKLPQSPDRFPVLATPDLKNVTLVLPEGLTVSPGGANGLAGCEATGPNGIDMPSGVNSEGRPLHPSEAGEGEAIGPDGMSHLTAGHCPQASQIGTVKIVTPLLESPLVGRAYLAQPQCGGAHQPACTAADATDGRLFGIYLEAAGSGVVLKLAGRIAANPATGQLTATFAENPQLPFSELALQLKGGARAPLANPRQCGEAIGSSALTPWSAPVTRDSIRPISFSVDWNGSGGPCPATLPFAPAMTAGDTNTQAGAFGPFTFTLARGDRTQDLARLQLRMPPGLLGMLSQVPLCEEPQASAGACSEASEIGRTTVAVGSGSVPYWVTGHVYLTGPYGGAPFGLSIVVPAVAGPFNLGNEVVRARIDVDPDTSALTVTTDPLPQFLDGVPLRLQTLNVAIDRPGFIFNPTNCGAKQIAATVAAEQGASANLSTPFAVEGCRNLPFKPTFAASTQTRSSKQNGASLAVKVSSGAGQANIAQVVVDLPKVLPSRLSTVQHACPAAVFASNPAACDPGSLVGTATATTPVLPVALSGPAYLVSHGGVAFPDLVVILQGDGVRVDLAGNINIAGAVTSSTFATLPDAPISSFDLNLPEGPHSALTVALPAKAKRNLCTASLLMPTTIVGQNGAQIRQSTRIAVTGCPRAKPKSKAKKKAKSKRAKSKKH
jgi:hypothetical protein